MSTFNSRTVSERPPTLFDPNLLPGILDRSQESHSVSDATGPVDDDESGDPGQSDLGPGCGTGIHDAAADIQTQIALSQALV